MGGQTATFSPDRFLGRLLLVHGTLADYRLGRLIKYSFYKNISFASMFFFFQFFNGWSGQASTHRLAGKARQHPCNACAPSRLV